MEVLNKGDQKIKGYPISFSFNEGEKVKVLNYGKEITEMEDEEFERMVGTLAMMLLKRTDKDMVVFNSKKSMVTIIKSEEK